MRPQVRSPLPMGWPLHRRKEPPSGCMLSRCPQNPADEMSPPVLLHLLLLGHAFLRVDILDPRRSRRPRIAQPGKLFHRRAARSHHSDVSTPLIPYPLSAHSRYSPYGNSSGFFLIFTTALVITHAVLIASNMTTLEQMATHRTKEREERVLGRLHSWWQFRFVSSPCSPLQCMRPFNNKINTHILLVLQGEVRDTQKVGPRMGPRRKRGAHLVARQLARELGKHDGRQGVDVAP